MKVKVVPALIGLGLVGIALAHDSWLLPSAFVAKPGEEVRLDLTSGMAFPGLDSPIQADRVAKAAFRIGKTETDISALKVDEKSLSLRTVFPKAGLATVWVELHPKDIELTDDDVTHYLDEINATKEIRSSWALTKGKIPWKETYRKLAKTFVAVGDAPSDDSWRLDVGAALEFVPGVDPRGIKVGDEVPVQLVARSKPFSGAPVGLRLEGGGDPVFRTTDAAGKATFPMSRAGRAMLFTVQLHPTSDGKAWKSDFCTLTLMVNPPRATAAAGRQDHGHPLDPTLR